MISLDDVLSGLNEDGMDRLLINVKAGESGGGGDEGGTITTDGPYASASHGSSGGNGMTWTTGEAIEA